MNKKNYILYLIISLFFWIGVVIIYKYAINEGHINKIMLLIITIVGMIYALTNLTLVKDNYLNDKKEFTQKIKCEVEK